jgi:hypothetical protein
MTESEECLQCGKCRYIVSVSVRHAATRRSGPPGKTEVKDATCENGTGGTHKFGFNDQNRRVLPFAVHPKIFLPCVSLFSVFSRYIG